MENKNYAGHVFSLRLVNGVIFNQFAFGETVPKALDNLAAHYRTPIGTATKIAVLTGNIGRTKGLTIKLVI